LIYRKFIRRLLFSLPPEKAHDITFKILKLSAPLLPLFKWAFSYTSPALKKNFCGLEFPNPVGLAAGLDKECALSDLWGTLGFGFVELGTITGEKQPGNPSPRLFRYPEEEALVNRMGFNSSGSENISNILRKQNMHKRTHRIPAGINIGKTRSVPLELASEDYKKSIIRLYPFADFFTINISSPNTPGLRELQSKKYLDSLLKELIKTCHETGSESSIKPLFLKISPDLTFQEIDDIIEICLSNNINGIVATNTTSQLSLAGAIEIEEGGLSGKPLLQKSTSILSYLRKNVPSDFLLTGCGGISDINSVKAKFDAGANLVQIYTGYIYEGPWLVKRLCREIAMFK